MWSFIHNYLFFFQSPFRHVLFRFFFITSWSLYIVSTSTCHNPLNHFYLDVVFVYIRPFRGLHYVWYLHSLASIASRSSFYWFSYKFPCISGLIVKKLPVSPFSRYLCISSLFSVTNQDESTLFLHFITTWYLLSFFNPFLVTNQDELILFLYFVAFGKF